MKKIVFVLFVLFLIVAQVAFAQKPGTIFPLGEAGKDYNVLDSKGKKQGPWFRVYKDNPKVLYYKGQFKNGIPTGVFEFYYETGDLLSLVDHVQDTTVNDVTYYHPDGKTIMSSGRYVGKLESKKWLRQKQGLWKMYDASGLIRSEENYKDGALDGICKYYYENGKLVSICQYVNGMKTGPYTEYYDSGKKRKEGSYLLDDNDGDYKSWNANGTLESEGKYLKGMQNGTWYFYDGSGVLSVSVLYEFGREVKRKYENGTYTLYYDDGIPKSEYSFENGKREGPFKEWYDIGAFVEVPGSKEDQEIGIAYREKLEGTQVKMEGDYLDDHLEGEITYYSEKGRIEKVEVWVGGILKETKSPNKE